MKKNWKIILCIALIAIFAFLVLVDKQSYDETVHSDVDQVKNPQTAESVIKDIETDEILDTEMNSEEEQTALTESDTIGESEEMQAKTLIVTKFTGLSYKNAKLAAEADGLTVHRKRVYNDTVKKGYIISQSPEEGTEVESGTAITLKVSKGPKPIQVPDVLGKSQSEADRILESAGLIVYNVETVHNTSAANGVVLDQSIAAGQSVAKGTRISLSVNAVEEESVRPTSQGSSSSGNSQSTGNSSSGSSQSTGSSLSGNSGSNSSGRDEDSWPGSNSSGGGAGQDEDSWTGD